MCEHYFWIWIINVSPILSRIYERFLSFGKREIIVMLVIMSAQRFALCALLTSEQDDGYLSLFFIVSAHSGMESVYCLASLPSIERNIKCAS